jgi:AcrR family transcriptional regulator
MNLDPRVRGGETRKRHTREKLLHAADAVMQKRVEPTVQDIAKYAGVSTATFYSFYTSRNELCADAFIVSVLVPLEAAGVEQQPFAQSVDALVRTCLNRQALVAAALIDLYERRRAHGSGLVLELVVLGLFHPSVQLTLQEDADFIDRTGKLMADSKMLNSTTVFADDLDPNVRTNIAWFLRGTTLMVLDSIARQGGVVGSALDMTVRPAFNALLQVP